MKYMLACALAATLLASVASAQTIAPSVVASIKDYPRDGLPNSISVGLPQGLIAVGTLAEDRAIQEYDLTGVSPGQVVSAVLSGRIQVNNSTDCGPRHFNFYSYVGNGTAELADFSGPQQLIGTASYHPPTDFAIDFSFEVTAQVQAVTGAASYFGLRVLCTSEPSYPNILRASLCTLTITPTGATTYCEGSGSPVACPCANNSPSGLGQGCVNSTGAGATLTLSGSTSVSADSLVATVANLPPNQFGLVYSGDNNPLFVFGDGLRCVGQNVLRYPISAADSGGMIVQANLASLGGATPGSQRHLQGWFRDPTGPCGSAFNLSAASTVVFTP